MVSRRISRRVGRRLAALAVAATLLAVAAVAAAAPPAMAVPVGQCVSTSPSWGYARLCRGTVGYGVTVDDTRTDGFCVELRRTTDGRTWKRDDGLVSCGSPVADGEFPITSADRRYGMRLYRGDGAYSTLCDGSLARVTGKPDC